MSRLRKPLTSKQRSVQQERRVAKSIGARLQPGSGNGRHRKSDMEKPEFLVEVKCRKNPDAKSISILLVALIENEMDALVSGRLGVVTFELGGRDWFISSDMVWAETQGTQNG